MTSIATAAPADTHDMVVVHRVFRREAGQLPDLVAAVAPGAVRRARVLAAHLRDYQLGLHGHHTAEDELLWPLLLARVDLEAELVLRMQGQHERIEATLDRVTAALPAWEAGAGAAARDELVAALRAHRVALVEHLADEEEHLLPVAQGHVTAVEWNRLGEHFVVHTPRNKLLFFLGAILEEADPAETDTMLGNLPPRARLAWRLLGRRAYARRMARVRQP